MDGRQPIPYMSGSVAVHSIEVTTRDLEGLPDARGDSVRSMLSSDFGLEVGAVRVSLGYLVKAEMNQEEAARSVYDLFADPVIEHGSSQGRLLDASEVFPSPPEVAIQVGFKPGVTDNAGQAGLDGLTTLFPHLGGRAQVATTQTYMFWDLPEGTDPSDLASALHNPMIERCAIAGEDDCGAARWPSLEFPDRPPAVFAEPAVVDLEVSDEELEEISETGLLALNLNEMHAIQAHYRDSGVREARESLGLPAAAPATPSSSASHRLGRSTARTRYSQPGLITRTTRPASPRPSTPCSRHTS